MTVAKLAQAFENLKNAGEDRARTVLMEFLDGVKCRVVLTRRLMPQGKGLPIFVLGRKFPTQLN